MQKFCKSFRQSIGNCFYHNRIVIIVFCFIFLSQFIGSKTCCYRKSTNVILFFRSFRSNKITQSQIFLSFRFFMLLTKRSKDKSFLFFFQFNIILFIRIGRKNPENCFCRQKFFRNNFLKHFLSISKKFGSLFANHFIFQNLWIFSKQIPTSKKRTPINIRN